MSEYLLSCFPPRTQRPHWIVSLFSSAKNNAPTTLEVADFAEIAEGILEAGHDVRTEKDGPAISLVEYAPGTTRAKQNVRRVFGAALDFDKVSAADMACVRAAFASVEHLVYTTFSDAPGARCFRLVVPFAESIMPVEYSAYWESLNSLAGDLADPAAKDVARISYLPAHPPGADDHFIEYHRANGGGAA